MARSKRQVYLDMNALTQPHVTGIGKYCLELFTALKNLPDTDYEFKPVIKTSRVKHLSKVKSRLRSELGISGITDLFRPRINPFAIYHGLDFRVPQSTTFKKVVTVHDLISFEKVFNSDQFVAEAKQNFEAMLFRDKPDLFICISDFTKKKFVEFYPDMEDRIKVVHLGCDHKITLHEDDRQSVLKKAVLPERFILSLGTIEFRKNTISVVRSFELIAKSYPGLHLVIAGAVGYRGQEVIEAIANSKFKDRIHHLNYVSDSLVDLLYRRAEAFIFPSLYEGFGLPILEAMKRGCPVVTAKGSATEEIAGNGAIVVDPNSQDEIAVATSKLLSESDVRQEIIEYGWQRTQMFTWEKTAQKTLEVYKGL